MGNSNVKIAGILLIGFIILFHSCEKAKNNDEEIFNPYLTYGIITDYEGNTYKTIQIGTQVWLAENLKAVKYNDGEAIPLVKEGGKWANLSTPGYCWYNNDSSKYNSTYGALYNWYTVNTGKLCPTGWHIPAAKEWAILGNFLDTNLLMGYRDYRAGCRLRSTGSTYWLAPNFCATNESGFSALPGGGRGINAHELTKSSFLSLGTAGFWWTSTEYSYDTNCAWHEFLYYNNNNARGIFIDKKFGLSVRCIKD